MSDQCRTDRDIDGPGRTVEPGGECGRPMGDADVAGDALAVAVVRLRPGDGGDEEPVQRLPLRAQVGERGLGPGLQYAGLRTVDESDREREVEHVRPRAEPLDGAFLRGTARRVEEMQRRVAGVDEIWQHHRHI
jgi:hypothetical protein